MKNIKSKILRLICKLFGHYYIHEKYAIKTNRRYRIFEKEYCVRCGQLKKISASCSLSRAEMLKRGWFIEDLYEKMDIQKNCH